MLTAALVFLFYFALATFAVLTFWIVQIRFGSTDDLDPATFLVRVFGKKSAAITSSKKPVESPQGYKGGASLEMGLERLLSKELREEKMVYGHAVPSEYALRLVKELQIARAIQESLMRPRKGSSEALLKALESALKEQVEPRKEEELLDRDPIELTLSKSTTIQ